MIKGWAIFNTRSERRPNPCRKGISGRGTWARCLNFDGEDETYDSHHSHHPSRVRLAHHRCSGCDAACCRVDYDCERTAVRTIHAAESAGIIITAPTQRAAIVAESRPATEPATESAACAQSRPAESAAAKPDRARRAIRAAAGTV